MSAVDVQLFAKAATRRRRKTLGLALVAVSAVWLVFVLVLAAFGYQLAPHDPHMINFSLRELPPFPGHRFGTDQLGRDILSRVFAGARTAIAGPALLALGTTLVATTCGLLAGYRGGALDTVISRTVDLMYALPALLVIIVVVGVLGGGYLLAVGVLTVFVIPADIRLIRSATLAQRELPYIESARTLGLSERRIMIVHILPNILPTVIATILLEFVAAIVTLSGLSFLGLGVQAGTPDWGLMISENRNVMDLNPWAVVAPAIAIALTAASATIVGDWLYDRFTESGSG
jgi:ABC-type dipeptide/oligopeptide/nickel transport system permease subunit